MQQPEELWKSFPLDPAPSSAPAVRQGESSPTPDATPAPAPEATTIAAATATPTPAPSPTPASGDAADGRIELPGGASITFPAGNGTEQAIAASPASGAVAASAPPSAQADAGELSAPAGQVGLFVVVVGVLVVLMARWLLNHTWRAAVTVAVLLLGVAALGVILVGWAADLGIVG